MRYESSLLCGLLLLGGCTPPPEPDATPLKDNAASKPSPSPYPQWTVDVQVNALDKTRHTVISDHSFFLRCGTKVDGYVIPYIPSLGHSLETNDMHNQTVRYRLNDGPVKRGSWSVSDDYTALFIPSSSLKKVVASQSMVIEFEPRYTTPQTDTWDLRGLQDEAKKAACKL